MFLRNWDKTLAQVLSSAAFGALTYKSHKGEDLQFTAEPASIIKTIQLTKNENSAGVPSLHKVQTSYGTYGGVVFGTGTTPPTKDDYCLSGTLLTNFAYSAGVTATPDATGVTIKAIYTITNTGSSDMTIGEIGLMCNMYDASNQVDFRKGFIERTVLDAPVTIPAGGIGQVTYTIRINYPA